MISDIHFFIKFKMKLAIISTINNLNLYEKGDILYYLPHIDDINYIKFFKTHNKMYKISDNSVWEDKQLNMAEFVLKSLFIDADEIVIPDIIGDMRRTITQKYVFMKWYYKDVKDKGMFVQAVIQGKTVKEIMYCYERFCRDKRIDVIGVPFALTPLKLHKEKYINQMLNRLTIIDKLNKVYNKKPIHLLGLNHPNELFDLRKYKFIRSNDSKLAVRCAINNVKFENYKTKPLLPLDFNYKLNKQQEETALHNINYLKQLVKDD